MAFNPVSLNLSSISNLSYNGGLTFSFCNPSRSDVSTILTYDGRALSRKGSIFYKIFDILLIFYFKDGQKK